MKVQIIIPKGFRRLRRNEKILKSDLYASADGIWAKPGIAAGLTPECMVYIAYIRKVRKVKK